MPCITSTRERCELAPNCPFNCHSNPPSVNAQRAEARKAAAKKQALQRQRDEGEFVLSSGQQSASPLAALELPKIDTKAIAAAAASAVAASETDDAELELERALRESAIGDAVSVLLRLIGNRRLPLQGQQYREELLFACVVYVVYLPKHAAQTEHASLVVLSFFFQRHTGLVMFVLLL